MRQELLLERGADINMPHGAAKYTLLATAAADGRADKVRFLLEHGANPEIKNAQGDTPLRITRQTGKSAEVVAILEEWQNGQDKP